MLEVVMVTLVVAQAPMTPASVTGAVSVTVLDKSGQMVADLKAEEVTIVEEGQPREVERVERDPRPLALALLVDASDSWGKSFLKDLVDPALDFLEALPAGTERSLFTVGTPPQRLDLQDLTAARLALKAKAPGGKLSLYDGMAEACRGLTERKGTRRIVIAVISDRANEEDRQKALDAAARATPQVFAVQFHGDGSYATGLDSIVNWTGGRYVQIGAASGVAKTLLKLMPELEPTWLVMYKTRSAAGARKLEIKVKRKGTKISWRSPGL